MSNIELFDLEPSQANFLQDVIEGLGESQKMIPPKYFYDEKGSQLFDEICDLDEYYPTRTEIEILNRNAHKIEALLPESCLILEYGSGSSIKIQKLLEITRKVSCYIPLDISKEHLVASANKISRQYPKLDIKAVCADYTEEKIREFNPGSENSRVVFFPGSTIGNLNPKEALELLRNTREFLGKDGLLILGIYLIKEKQTLINAYNDKKGVTAAFNLNVLHRINSELGANFDLKEFEHTALYNDEKNRIEMHLVSQSNQTIEIGDNKFSFNQNETIAHSFHSPFTTSAYDNFAFPSVTFLS